MRHAPRATTTLPDVIRRLALLAVPLGLAAPGLVSAPAFAATSVICVGVVDPLCTDTQPTIQAGYAAAVGTAIDDTVLLGAATYSNGPWVAPFNDPHEITLRGAGQGQTILTLPSNATIQTYLALNDTAVQDLTVQLAPGPDSSGDLGISMSQGRVDRVTVDGAGTDNGKGISTSLSTIT